MANDWDFRLNVSGAEEKKKNWRKGFDKKKNFARRE